MNKMEITNHGRGLTLTRGLASIHVCVLLGFVEGLCAEIDGFGVCVFCWNLLKDYMLKLMVFNMCVLVGFC